MGMDTSLRDYSAIVHELEQHSGRTDGASVASQLVYGLNLLRDSFLQRVFFDVERAFGKDSMLIPVSASKTEARLNEEIEVFQIVESAAEVRQSGFSVQSPEWFMQWLGGIRLRDSINAPQVLEKVARQASKDADDRRKSFANHLERILPESAKAPLVLFRLFPVSVRITTCMAFGDTFRAAELRNHQLRLLPYISDCRECHGRLLENGEKCRECGNPVWRFHWLNAE